jgi:D-galactarolactone isomerase
MVYWSVQFCQLQNSPHEACDKVPQMEDGNRRSFLKSVLPMGTTGVAALCTWAKEACPLPVPQPSSSEMVNFEVPTNATDAHHHIYDSRFPPDPSAKLRPADATVADYRRLQGHLGTTRSVVVQPSTYGVDNRCLLDALSRFGTKTAVGIAVVDTTVSDEQLKRLHHGGVRGIRFNLVQAGATTPEMIKPLTQRIASLGWHIQVNASSEQILSMAEIWERIPVPVVFDHFGHVSQVNDQAFSLICRLMQNRKAWTKLSGAETISKSGEPDYADMTAVTKAFIQEAPDRLLWGTNWPHPTSNRKPDDVTLMNLLARWAPDRAIRNKILVRNPAELFASV